MDTELASDIETFRDVARRFCALIDAAAKLNQRDLLLTLNSILPELYGAALRLPDVPPTTGDASDCRLSHEAWSDTFRAVASKLDPLGVYWTVTAPSQLDAPVAGHLADDVADIYRDLQEGMALAAEGAAPADVLWMWRFSFQTHWGAHAVEALRAIHHLVWDHLVPVESQVDRAPSRG